MDRYTRAFIVASLFYLAAGGILGLHMRISPDSYDYLRFPHVHVLLAGFMAMMVFGVGYFILPRFAARTLRWPWMVAWHFWLANASLLAMVIAEPMETAFASGIWPALGAAGAVVQALSFLVFAGNLGLTLLSGPAEAAARAGAAPEKASATAPGGRSLPVVGQPRPAAPPLGPGTPVADFVDRKEGARELLVQAGLQPLRDPQHLEMVRARGVTLEHACERHGIPLPAVLPRLLALPDRPGPGGVQDLGADQIIGDLVARHPAAREVLRRRFGEGCFTCPGFETETLAQGALMHGVEVEDLLEDLRRAVLPGGKA